MNVFRSPTWVVTGNGVIELIESPTPPRLLGDDCGCVRTRTANGWKLEPCKRHGTEPISAFDVL